jgi:pyrroline-5-carboxylate reductase
LLLINNKIPFTGVIDRVARKGGMTEIGVKEIKENMPSIYDNIFEKTFKKYRMRKKEINENFV